MRSSLQRGHFRRLCGAPLGAGAERRLLGQRQGLPGELQSGPELQEVYLQDRVESARLIRGGDGVKRGCFKDAGSFGKGLAKVGWGCILEIDRNGGAELAMEG